MAVASLALFGFIALFGCQLKPTLITEESVNQHYKDVVLVDTRGAFEFAGFHFSGSVSLNSEDFLILKNPKSKKRILDPDISQIIERLARRGLSPQKALILISNKKDSLENKKWNWLLRQLEIENIVLMGFDEYRALNKNRVPQAPPASMQVWKLRTVEVLLKKADQCFVNWSNEGCH